VENFAAEGELELELCVLEFVNRNPTDELQELTEVHPTIGPHLVNILMRDALLAHGEAADYLPFSDTDFIDLFAHYQVDNLVKVDQGLGPWQDMVAEDLEYGYTIGRVDLVYFS